MDEKRGLAGLWAVPGIGPKTVALVRKRFVLSQILDCVIQEWCDVYPEVLLPYAAQRIPRGRTLAELGDELLDRATRAEMKIAWLGEKEYPARLESIDDPPPLLFYWGPGTDSPPRRRVGMVGARKPDSRYLPELRALAFEVAEQGIGIVSGAAHGIDTLVHSEAVRANGETWAFVGSGLDQLDTHQARLWSALRDHGATFWSELPPGVRAEPRTFPRRNRLISGTSDAVAVLRANLKSGTKHTVKYALRQGRKVLAYPGSPKEPLSRMATVLLQNKAADICACAGDVMKAVGVTGYVSQRPKPVETKRVDPASLSPNAQAAYGVLKTGSKYFDELVGELNFRSGALVAALFELTHGGLVVEWPGKRYEKL